jgi:hypothetical protein
MNTQVDRRHRQVDDIGYTVGERRRSDAQRLVETHAAIDRLIRDIVDDGAYNALGTGLVKRLLDIRSTR